MLFKSRIIAAMIAGSIAMSLLAGCGKDVPADTSSVVSSDASQSDTEEAITDSEVVDTDTKEESMIHMGKTVSGEIDNLFKAISEGNIDQIVALSGNDTLAGVREAKEMGKILNLFYGDMTWNTSVLTDEYILDAYETASSLGRDSMIIKIPTVSRQFHYYSLYDLLRYEPGSHVDEGLKEDWLTQPSVDDTYEAAWDNYKETIDIMPLTYSEWELKMSIPDDSGKFKFDLDSADIHYMFDSASNLPVILVQSGKTELLPEMLNEICYHDVYVSPEDAVVKYNSASDDGGAGMRAAAIRYMSNGYFSDAAELVFEKTGKEINNVVETYNGFTETQQDFVDGMYEQFTIHKIETARSLDGESDVMFIIEYMPFETYLPNRETPTEPVFGSDNVSLEVFSATSQRSAADFVDWDFDLYSKVIDFVKNNVE